MEGLNIENKNQSKQENEVWDELLNDPNFKDAAKEVEDALAKIEEQRRETEAHMEKEQMEKGVPEKKEQEPAKAA
jgi:DNA polymerase elongation subunit (family B)